MAKLLGVPASVVYASFGLQVVHYAQGGHVHCHHDSHDPSDSDSAGKQTRAYTILFFLNTPAEGGGTWFPALNVNRNNPRKRTPRADEYWDKV